MVTVVTLAQGRMLFSERVSENQNMSAGRRRVVWFRLLLLFLM